ncbi:hypothetical protein [Leyella stercorea]|uniref:hypothetical protein n=1 Tax=Leyella stercorea TaxID=363265 RepID=UPI0026DBC673|nr:hypothetical protein [Leyella stercorea]
MLIYLTITQVVIITPISSGETRYKRTQASNKDKKAVYLRSKRVLTEGLITTKVRQNVNKWANKQLLKYGGNNNENNKK